MYESKAYSTVPPTYANYSNQLQIASHEEGRIRALRLTPQSNPTGFAYDYFLKDHLGNVRMVLTDEVKMDDYPTVTMEDVNEANESLYYSQANSQTRANRHPEMPADGSTTPNQRAAVLSINGQRIGPGILLKVQAGDELELWCRSFWQGTMAGQTNSNQTGIKDGIATLLGSLMPGASGGKIKGGQTGTNGSFFGPAILSFLQAHNPAQTTKPKAYVNWLFLDDQFNYKAGNGSGAEAIGASNAYPLHERSKTLNNSLQVKQSGYVYIYTNNESSLNVYFDNLKVKHHRGPLLEETHYYPFGLTMAGISSKATYIKPNKEQTFQEQRFDDDLGVNYIQFKYRSHDPQIGRFIQIDPLSHDYRYNSTYAFSENRVTDGRELEGLEYISIHHYGNGTNGIKLHYKSSDAEINKIHGTTAGIYNSASYGPLGKGVVHYYYKSDGEVYQTRWDQRQTGGSSDFRFHGLYSGPGSVTKDGGENSTNYDFSFQPIDMSDAIAKRHDMDYSEATATGEAYAGFLEDVRTLQADKDMLQRLDDFTNPFRDVKGVETPYRTSLYSGEQDGSIIGQKIVIGALARYKQWKIDNGYGNKDTYDKLRPQFVKKNPGTTDIIDLITQ